MGSDDVTQGGDEASEGRRKKRVYFQQAPHKAGGAVRLKVPDINVNAAGESFWNCWEHPGDGVFSYNPEGQVTPFTRKDVLEELGFKKPQLIPNPRNNDHDGEEEPVEGLADTTQRTVNARLPDICNPDKMAVHGQLNRLAFRYVPPIIPGHCYLQ